jgi:hypothetical protein
LAYAAITTGQQPEGQNDLFLNGPRIVQIIREIDPIPYDFRERFLKQVRWTFLQKGS